MLTARSHSPRRLSLSFLALLLLCLVYSTTRSANALEVLKRVKEEKKEEEKPFFCVLTMVHDEHMKARSFVPHYLAEGAARIFVFDDRSDPPFHYDHPSVTVERVDSIGLEVPEWARYKRQIYMLNNFLFKRAKPAGCQWVASIDIDELITTVK